MSAKQSFVAVGCDGRSDSDAALRFAAAEEGLHGAVLVVVITYDRPIDSDADDLDVSAAQLQRQPRDSVPSSPARAVGAHGVKKDRNIAAVIGTQPARW